MKATVQKQKNWRGRIVGYTARIGEVTADASTPAEASEQCDRKVIATIMRLDRGTIVGQWNGHTYVIAPTVTGWAYWIDTMAHGNVHQEHVGTREEVQDAALAHLAQNVWAPSADDATFIERLPREVAAEISRWIRWQRSYIALRGQGKTENEAHQLASYEGVGT